MKTKSGVIAPLVTTQVSLYVDKQLTPHWGTIKGVCVGLGLDVEEDDSSIWVR